MGQMTLFDYGALDAETRIVVQQRTGEIRGLMRRAAQDIVDIGLKLIEVKEQLAQAPNRIRLGRVGAYEIVAERISFESWLKDEFDWSRQTAYRFIWVAERFAGECNNLLQVAPSALYLLSAPSTPETARLEAIERATSGEPITHAKAKEIVNAHREPATPAPAPFVPPATTPDLSTWSHVCPDCGEQFPCEVWHCPECGEHNPEGADSCRKCDSERGAVPVEEPDDHADEFEAVEPDEPDEEDFIPPPPPPPPARSSLPIATPAPAPSQGRIGKTGEFVTLPEWEAEWDASRRARLWESVRSVRSSSTAMNRQEGESIEWALWSWNPVTGCRHNCPYCYARDIAERIYEPRFEPALWPDRLHAPFNVKVPDALIAAELANGTEAGRVRAMGLRNVFTCSMADLFGQWVPSEWVEAVIDVAKRCPQWNFLFLTKFPQRLCKFEFPANAWVGTSVDCQARVANAEKAFRKLKCGVKWLSCEPLIEPLHFEDVGAFDWIVIGGASRSTKTPEWHPPRSWVSAIEDEAARAGVKVYEKSNLLERIRQYPGLDPSGREAAPDAFHYLGGRDAS